MNAEIYGALGVRVKGVAAVETTVVTMANDSAASGYASRMTSRTGFSDRRMRVRLNDLRRERLTIVLD